MPSYDNGKVPEELLVKFAWGANTVDGVWYHGLPAATYARHLALVARAMLRTGRKLAITDGWGAYRPLAAQYIARAIYGIGAAWPGTSSHGLFWESRQVAAMDYGNWAWVYAQFGGNARAEFYADCRAVGLSPGLISEERGYPDEPWHVVDENPWAAFAGGNAVPFPETTPKRKKKRMAGVIICRKDIPTQLTYYFDTGYVKHLSGEKEVQTMKWALDDEVRRFDDEDFLRAIWGFGLDEFSINDLEGLAVPIDGVAGRSLVASWLKTDKPVAG